METQENKSKEQPAVEAGEVLNEQQLESVQGGGLERAQGVADWTKVLQSLKKRTASEAGMTQYHLDTKIPRTGNMKDVSGK